MTNRSTLHFKKCGKLLSQPPPRIDAPERVRYVIIISVSELKTIEVPYISYKTMTIIRKEYLNDGNYLQYRSTIVGVSLYRDLRNGVTNNDIRWVQGITLNISIWRRWRCGSWICRSRKYRSDNVWKAVETEICMFWRYHVTLPIVMRLYELFNFAHIAFFTPAFSVAAVLWNKISHISLFTKHGI